MKEIMTDEKCAHLATPVKGVSGLWGSSLRGGMSYDPARVHVILEERLLPTVLSARAPFFTGVSGVIVAGGEGFAFQPLEVNLRVPNVVYWPWRDMSVPEDVGVSAKRLEWLTGLSEIEVACWGGHGRTGTVLAVLGALLAGWKTEEAVDRLRDGYCDLAVETQGQVGFVVRVLQKIRGEAAVEDDKRVVVAVPAVSREKASGGEPLSLFDEDGDEWVYDDAKGDYVALGVNVEKFVESTVPKKREVGKQNKYFPKSSSAPGKTGRK